MAPVDTTPEHTITVRATDLTAGGHPLPKNWLVRVVLIWSGYALSAIAGNAVSYSGVWYITETTGSPMALSLMYVLAFLPMGLLAPLGGVLADRHSRKKIIVACDAVMAVSGAVVATVMVLFGPSYAAVIAMTAVWGFMSAFRAPAFNATMPLLVPERHLMRINGLDAVLGSVSMIAAPPLGILLYTSLGLHACVILGCVGSVAAVTTMLLAKVPRVTTDRTAGPLQSMREGARTLAQARGLLVLVITVSLGMMAYGPVDSLLPLMVSTRFGGDGFAASLVAAVMGAGMMVGSLVLMAVNPKRGLARIINVAAFVFGGFTVLAGLIPEGGYWLFVACVGVMAIVCAWFNAPLMTLLQRGIVEEKLGRVMGLFNSLVGLAVPIGTALGCAVAELVGTPLFFCIDGALVVMLAVALLMSKSVRELEK